MSYDIVITLCSYFSFLNSKQTVFQEMQFAYSCIPNGDYFTFQEYILTICSMCYRNVVS